MTDNLLLWRNSKLNSWICHYCACDCVWMVGAHALAEHMDGATVPLLCAVSRGSAPQLPAVQATHRQTLGVRSVTLLCTYPRLLVWSHVNERVCAQCVIHMSGM